MIVDRRHGSKREEISYSVELCCLLASLQNVNYWLLFSTYHSLFCWLELFESILYVTILNQIMK